MKDRLINRSKGCFNCRSFDMDDGAISKWKKRYQTDTAFHEGQGKTAEQVVAALEPMEAILQGIQKHEVGICTNILAIADMEKAANTRVDFIAKLHLCHCWDAIPGDRHTTNEKATDDVLPGELADRFDMGDKE